MATALRQHRMTIAEFLRFDDGSETRYELEHGMLVAMPTRHWRHNLIKQNIAGLVDERVRMRLPCQALQNTGVVVDAADDRVYIPDVLMTCEQLGDYPLTEAPSLIVEVLSPSTEGLDKRDKLIGYMRLPSVQEIWLVDGRKPLVMVWRRRGEGWLPDLPHQGDTSFTSDVLAGEVQLTRFYDRSGVG